MQRDDYIRNTFMLPAYVCTKIITWNLHKTTKMDSWQHEKKCYNTELRVTITTSMVFREDFINPTSPHINFWSTIITVILFYFIFMQNISLTSRSCFQYMFSILHKRPAGSPFAILHFQIIHDLYMICRYSYDLSLQQTPHT
jgi:hypothetical protein